MPLLSFGLVKPAKEPPTEFWLSSEQMDILVNRIAKQVIEALTPKVDKI